MYVNANKSQEHEIKRFELIELREPKLLNFEPWNLNIFKAIKFKNTIPLNRALKIEMTKSIIKITKRFEKQQKTQIVWKFDLISPNNKKNYL